MNVRDEINAYSLTTDKPVLNWLFDRYHWQSQWRFVAICNFEQDNRVKYGRRRVWTPSNEGKALYNYYHGIRKGEVQ